MRDRWSQSGVGYGQCLFVSTCLKFSCFRRRHYISYHCITVIISVILSVYFMHAQRESKNKIPNSLVHIFAKYITDFHFFHWYTEQEICKQAIITDTIIPPKCRYTTS